MKKIKKIRFNALAGYIRDFKTQLIGKETAWYKKEWRVSSGRNIVAMKIPDKSFKFQYRG